MARTELGLDIETALLEAASWTRGEIALETVNYDPLPPARIRAIRKRVAKSAKAFERRFGISAATVNNWEQGRTVPDAAARILLKTIELDPDLVERAARAA